MWLDLLLCCNSCVFLHVHSLVVSVLMILGNDWIAGMLSLKDLGDAVAQKLQGCLSEGSELYGRKNDHVYSCKIERVVKDGEKTRYEVAWLDKYERMPEDTAIDEEDLIRCKLRFSRAFLKSFIRESTYRSIPWVLHERLAKKHGIPTDPPDDLKDQFSMQDGVVVVNRKRKKSEDSVSALVTFYILSC